jgi:hypothetical protein
MNEQIDQLMVKAGAYFGGDGVVYDNFDPKKFAELIIRECARAVDKVYEDAEPDHGCYDWATWAEGADVLKHFGVEDV